MKEYANSAAAFTFVLLISMTSVSGNAVETGEYVVMEGDCLWDIADKELGDPVKWLGLYENNKDQIANPDLIYPNQVFVLRSEGEAMSREDRGCVSFRENFEDGNAQDGKPVSWEDASGSWYVADGVYRIDNSPSTTGTTYDLGGNVADFQLEYEINIQSGVDRLIYLRQVDSRNYYEFNIRRAPHTNVVLTKMVDGKQTVIFTTGSSTYPNVLDHWYKVTLKVVGNQFDITVDDGQGNVYTHTAYDSEFASGGIALVGHHGTLLIDNVRLQCLP